MRNLLKGKISLIACGLLVSSSMAFGADSIDGAFKDGKVSGSANVYYEGTDYKTTKSDGYTAGTVFLGYETASYMGLSAKVGFAGAHQFTENNNGDFDGDFESNAMMSEANVTYAIDGASLTVGRQAVSLEWAGDYHEAAVAAITAIPDTTLVLVYSDKSAVADIDGFTDGFNKLNGKKGVYIAEATYKGLNNFEFTPYYYSIPDVADWAGLKSVYSSDAFGAVAHYAGSSEDTQDDGSVLHVEASTSIADLSLALGYIKTDKDVGAGSMTTNDDNINPFDSGNNVYSADAKTTYGSLGYTVAGVELGLLYGETKYASADYKEKELNLTAGYSFTDAFSGSILYADINGDEKDTSNATEDQDYVLANVTYTF